MILSIDDLDLLLGEALPAPMLVQSFVMALVGQYGVMVSSCGPRLVEIIVLSMPVMLRAVSWFR